MMRWMRFAVGILCFVALAGLQAQDARAVAHPGVLSTEETQRLMPPSVFFQGQTATVQIRNSFGVRFGDGGLVLAGLVDTGGYSSAIREKYQFYLLADTAIEVGGKRIGPGAYGCGFLPEQDGGFVVMDLGGHELLRTPIAHDAALARPRPLQMRGEGTGGEFRLYLGRDFVGFRQGR